MGYWLVDRFLPGLAATAVWAPAAFWLQHRALSRKVTAIASEQTAELKKHISGGEGGDRRP